MTTKHDGYRTHQSELQALNRRSSSAGLVCMNDASLQLPWLSDVQYHNGAFENDVRFIAGVAQPDQRRDFDVGSEEYARKSEIGLTCKIEKSSPGMITFFHLAGIRTFPDDEAGAHSRRDGILMPLSKISMSSK